MSEDAGELREVRRRLEEALRRLEDGARRLDTLEAQLEALDASFVRHQGQNEDDFRRAEQSVDRVGSDLSHHESQHFRSSR